MAYRRYFLSILLIFLIPVIASALTVANENLELKIYETNGRFSLYSLGEDGKKTALFLDRDPRTTLLTLLVGNKTYSMGDSFEYRQTIEELDSGVEIVWKSRAYTVRERLLLSATELTVRISVENNSETTVNMGIRVLLDTSLGEDGNHFYADGIMIEKETDFVWAAPEEIESIEEGNASLVITLNGRGITDPDRVVLANWKRLTDDSWTFEANQNRDFSLLPYSVDDSAVAIYYDPTAVEPSSSRAVSYRLSSQRTIHKIVLPSIESFSPTPSTTSTTSTTSTIATSTVEVPPDSPPADFSGILEEMSKIDALLEKIERVIQSESEPSQSEIISLQNDLEELEKQRSEYADN